MSEYVLCVLLLLVSVFLSSISQIILKLSTKEKYKSFIQEYLNFKVIFAYILFLLSTMLTMISYKGIPLSLGPVLEATGYFWVAILGLFILGERVSRKKMIGLGVILIGIMIFNL